MAAQSMEQLVALCKRRGFIFQSCQIYGGVQGLYDYGPMGIELKRALKDTWWRDMIYARDDMEGLDASILMHPQVLCHSGHEDTFSDPMVDCRQCKSRWRADHLEQPQCPQCGGADLTEPRPFNLMFQTHVGPVVEDNNKAYLRPETAQGIFINFKHVLDATSRKLPFGIAQIGKAFRNEITPRNFIFRVREFEQMEVEFFVKPGEDEAWHKYWIKNRLDWWKKQGLSSDSLVCEEQTADDLSHYSKATVDILYRFPHGLEELEGVANRTDFDLGSHTKEQGSLNISANVKSNTDSTGKLAVQDLESKEWFVPYVIEPSAGVDRGVLAILAEAYHEETLENGQTRTVLKLKPHLSPVKVAVVPLARNQADIVDYAHQVLKMLRQQAWGRVVYENTGNIGKAYRRHDEVGTPVCVTIDFDTIGKDGNAELKNTVTVRDRDSLKQERVGLSELTEFLTTNYFSYKD